MSQTKLKKDIRMLRAAAKRYLEMSKDNSYSAIQDAPMFHNHCSLCAHYIEGNCFKCPIRQHTGKEDCDGTPHDTLYKLREKLINGSPAPRVEAAIRAAWPPACRRQADFLTLLAEKLEKKLEVEDKGGKPAVTSGKALKGDPGDYPVGTIFASPNRGSAMVTTTMIKTAPLTVLFINAATKEAVSRAYETKQDMNFSIGKCVPISTLDA